MAKQKKAPITLAEMHRAAHASRNMTEKRFDDLIEKAKTNGKLSHVKMLEISRDACLAALDARLEIDDVLVEFEDDLRVFYSGLLKRRRIKMEEAKRKDAA